MNEFEKLANSLMDKYGIQKLHAECYLCNFYDEFICGKSGGKCKYITECKSVREAEDAIKMMI